MRSNIQEKVKKFTWRTFHNMLPVASNLNARGCDTCNLCWFCGCPNETADHIFLKCWWTSAFWNFMGLHNLIKSGSSGDVGDWLWFWIPRLSANELSLILYGLRKIWFCRNELALGKNCIGVKDAAVLTKDKVATFLNPSFKFHIVADSGGLIWEKLEFSFFKINCDGSCFPNLQRLGFGCVVSDSEGSIVAVKAGYHFQGFNALDAEGMTLVMAMNWAVEHRWNSCIFETDCSEVIHLLQTGPSSSNLSWEWLKICSSIC